MKINEVFFTENCIQSIYMVINHHKLQTEVGGTLVGYQNDDYLVITHASDPGRNTNMFYDSIEIDGEYATNYCNDINQRSNHKLYFLGDWHTHLSNNLNPSSRDLIAMKHLAEYTPSEYRDSLITVIVNHNNPIYIKVYSLLEGVKLESISHSIIPTPSWVKEYI